MLCQKCATMRCFGPLDRFVFYLAVLMALFAFSINQCRQKSNLRVGGVAASNGIMSCSFQRRFTSEKKCVWAEISRHIHFDCIIYSFGDCTAGILFKKICFITEQGPPVSYTGGSREIICETLRTARRGVQMETNPRPLTPRGKCPSHREEDQAQTRSIFFSTRRDSKHSTPTEDTNKHSSHRFHIQLFTTTTGGLRRTHAYTTASKLR